MHGGGKKKRRKSGRVGARAKGCNASTEGRLADLKIARARVNFPAAGKGAGKEGVRLKSRLRMPPFKVPVQPREVKAQRDRALTGSSTGRLSVGYKERTLKTRDESKKGEWVWSSVFAPSPLTFPGDRVVQR